MEKVSGGRLKIEHLPAGAIVGAFEVLDATNRGVIDGGHTAAAYWVGKHFAAGLLCCPPGGPFGMDHHDFLGWMYEGGGLELYQEFYQEVLNMQVVAFPILPIGPQALGWFKDVIRSWDDFKGMKYRIPGVAAEVFKAAGVSVVTLPGAEILPAAERGVIDAAEWVGGLEDLRLGFHNVWKIHYTPSMHETRPDGRIADQQGSMGRLAGGPAGAASRRGAGHRRPLVRVVPSPQRRGVPGTDAEARRAGVQDAGTTSSSRCWSRGTRSPRRRRRRRTPSSRRSWNRSVEYASLIVPYRLSTWPPYGFAGNYYWKDAVFGKTPE